jgi:hypothetical protein
MSSPAFRAGVVGATFLLCSSFVPAQSAPPAHPPRPKVVGPAKWKPMPQEVTAPYWTLEPGWSTQLELRNNLVGHELTVTPVLRVNTGQEIPMSPMTIAPQHVVSVDLRTAGQVDAGLLDHAGSFGSVAFRFDGLDAANLFAASMVSRDGHPIDFHFDGDDAGENYKSGGVEGIWWLPTANSTDYLILSNPMKERVAGGLTLSAGSGVVHTTRLTIGPGETKRIDLRELLGSSASATVGGVSLSLPGKELLSTTQIVFDEISGLGAIMKLFDREPDDLPSNRVLRAPMLALSQPDPGLAIPKGTVLVPRIFLAECRTRISACHGNDRLTRPKHVWEFFLAAPDALTRRSQSHKRSRPSEDRAITARCQLGYGEAGIRRSPSRSDRRGREL